VSGEFESDYCEATSSNRQLGDPAARMRLPDDLTWHAGERLADVTGSS
jgi:hypothetical protein